MLINSLVHVTVLLRDLNTTCLIVSSFNFSRCLLCSKVNSPSCQRLKNVPSGTRENQIFFLFLLSGVIDGGDAVHPPCRFKIESGGPVTPFMS